MKLKKAVLSLTLIALIILSSSLTSYASSDAIKGISAESACLIEAQSGKVLYSKRSSKHMPMASTTKIMTALIALESDMPLDAVLSVPKAAVGIEGSSMYLADGEKITLETLLYGLLLSSANDASVAIAIHISGSVEAFVDEMNKKADELELNDTHFTNPSGLYDEDHYTSAEDLCTLMAYCMTNSRFAEISGCQRKVAPRLDDGTRVLTNHNRLLSSYDGVIAGKTGFTKKSGRCLVTCAERDGMRLIAVTLNAPNDWSDHTTLYDFGFSNYKRIIIGPTSVKLHVTSGKSDEIQASSIQYSVLVSADTDPSKIDITVLAPHIIFAPIKAGDRIGTVVYRYNESIIAELPLLADDDVNETDISFNFFEWLINILKEIIWKR